MVVAELIAKLGFDVDSSGIQKADKGMSSLTDSAIKFGAVLLLAKQAFDGLMYTLKVGSEMENLTSGFKVILGDLDTAKYLMQEINQYANVSPFETAGVAQGVKMLMASGVAAADALNTIKKMGDIALGDQVKLDRLSLVFAQVKSFGKLQGDDLRQMAQGSSFNPLKFLAEKRGVSEASLRALSEKGKISYDDLLEAMDYATSKGQMFYKGAEEGAKTLSGRWSTLLDNFKLGLVEVAGEGTPLYQFFKDLLDKLIELSPVVLGFARNLEEAFGVFLADGPTAEDTANGIGAGLQTAADAAITLMIVMEQLRESWLGWKALGGVIVLGIEGLVIGLVQFVGVMIEALLTLITGALDAVVPDSIQAKLGMDFDTNQIHEVIGGQIQRVSDYWEREKEAARQQSDDIRASEDKQNRLRDMIGGSKEGKGPIELTQSMLQKLWGDTKVVDNSVHTQVTVHAEGSLKDILTEQANDIFGIAMSTRLQAATV